MAAIAIMAAVSVSGCAEKGGKDTVGKAAAEGYQDTLYMRATGLGQTESAARDQAVAELSRIFESQVQSDTLDRVRLVATEVAETSEQRLDAEVRVMSSVELQGVEIARTWKEGGTYYAMAVLERPKARDAWQRDILNIDTRAQGLLEALGSVESRLMRFRSLNAVASLWIEREVLVSRIRVLGYGEAPPPPYDAKDVFRRLAETRASMPIYVSVTGEHGPGVREAVAGALGREGFVLADSASGADVTVEGSVEILPVQVENPERQYARARISLKVADARTGLSLGEVTENRRGTHLTRVEAVRRALDKATPAAAGKVVSLIMGEGAQAP